MPRKRKDGIRLSKEHGLQPTILMCPYCGKPKNEVALLGAKGDKLAKELGRADGEMPMYAKVPGDIEPCEECSKTAILVLVTKGEHGPLVATAMIKDEWFQQNISDEKLRENILKTRKCGFDVETARAIGMNIPEDI